MICIYLFRHIIKQSEELQYKWYLVFCSILFFFKPMDAGGINQLYNLFNSVQIYDTWINNKQDRIWIKVWLFLYLTMKNAENSDVSFQLK